MSKVRVRFAPQPYRFSACRRSGPLLQLAVARKHGGSFVLRIEDTDLARSTDESVQGILEGMRFLALIGTEGPGVGGSFGLFSDRED